MPERFGEEVARLLPQLRFDELLDELQTRLDSVRSSRDRVAQLLEAVVGIGSGLDLEQALARIVRAATTLVDARYGALGVIGGTVGGQQRLARFITVGLAQEEIDAIGPYPEGHGLLGELIRNPAPLRSEDLATHPHSSGFPADHPPMHTFLGVPVRVRDEVFGNLYLTEKNGGAPFDADDEAMLTALAAAAGVAIDNARLYDDSRRRQQWLEITAELTRGLLSGQDADDVLASFVQRVRGFAQADLVVLVQPHEEDQLLVVAADGGPAAQRVRGVTFGLEDTLVGAVFKSAERVLVADLAVDPRVGRDLVAGLGPALVLPVGAAGQVRGVLALSRRTGAEQFDSTVVNLLADLALQAAVVLELAQRRRDTELLSLYADRDRIGRDLHDLAIQRLFALSMSLQGAYKITEKPAVAARLAQGITDLDDTIKVIRSTIFALNTHELGEQDSSVRAGVVEVCEQATGLLGFPPAVRFTGPVDTLVGAEVADHLLAVLREALSNVARHARASGVDVAVAVDGITVTLTVTDDGIGIAPGGRRSGLANQGERAEQLGGDCTVEPGAGQGTVLTWKVPLDAEPAGNEPFGDARGAEGP
jgi:signal transduction histidine kinase